jgi:glucose-6-phosphate 1-dehydrogenase
MPDVPAIRVPSSSHRVDAPPRRAPKAADACALVIFGAGGDLTRRLVVPALYNLARTGALPRNFALIGVGHGEGDVEQWREQLFDRVRSFVGNPRSEFSVADLDRQAWKRLAESMSYVRGDFDDPSLYQKIHAALGQAEQVHGTRGNAIFYLAVPDRFFGPIVAALGNAGLTGQQGGEDGKPRCWRRVVIEKPFGHSLPSARALNAEILQTLREDQIFRIDHFLGKDTVQSIMAFRFANGLFEPIWNRDRIDHVQITVAETVGVEGRGRFYEATGALRDMVPNHVLTLLSMVAMEPPTGFHADAIRSKRADVLVALRSVEPHKAVRGQYGAGTVFDRPVKAYRDETNVAPRTEVETYVAMQLEVDNWRWAGVPFFIRTGKHLCERLTEIAIRFKQAPYAAFEDTPVDTLRPNWLVLRIAPDEGISLQFEVKCRGPSMDLAAVKMDFRYDDWFPREQNVGYETLLYDVMIGDQTLFMRADMVEQTWRIVQQVLDHWAAKTPEFPNYASGSAGPGDADELIAQSGRQWRPVGLPARNK